MGITFPPPEVARAAIKFLKLSAMIWHMHEPADCRVLKRCMYIYMHSHRDL